MDRKTFNMSIGEQLAAMRENAGLTQHQLAVRSGLTGPDISRWENGSGLSLWALARLASALDFSIDSLIDWDAVQGS